MGGMVADETDEVDPSKESVAAALAAIGKISFVEVVANPYLQAEYLSYLTASNSRDHAKLLFLVSLEEFKKMCVVQGNEEDEIERSSSSSSVYAIKMIKKYMTQDSLMDIASDSLTIFNNSVWMYGQILEEKLKLHPSSIATIDLFDDVEQSVKIYLNESFTKFINSLNYKNVVSLQSKNENHRFNVVFRDILKCKELCSIFWIYLFTGRTHQSLSLWMDIEFRLKPCCQDDSDESEFWQLAMSIGNQYLKAGAVSEIPSISDYERKQFDHLYHYISDNKEGRQAVDLMRMLVGLQKRIESNLEVNQYIKFVSSSIYKEILLPYRDQDERNDCTSVVVELLHTLNISNHQPQRLCEKHDLEKLVQAQGHSVVAVISFYMNENPSDPNDVFTSKTLYHSQDEMDNLPEHLDRFFIPSGAKMVQSKEHPSPSLFSLTLGTSEQLYYAACLTRYCLVDAKKKLYQPAGLCILSKFPLLNTLRNRLRDIHVQLKNNLDYSSHAKWEATEEQLVQLISPCSPTCRGGSSPLGQIDFSLESLFGCVDIGNVIKLVTFSLLEKKIVLVSSYYSVLTTAAESLRLLIRPLVWSHVYAPVLPKCMMGCLQCPTPFLFGLHSSYAYCDDYLPESSDDFVIVNLDKNKVLGGGDVKLPVDIDLSLSEKLFVMLRPKVAFSDRILASKRENIFPEKEIRGVFLGAVNQLLEKCLEYRFVLADEKDNIVVFDEQAFLSAFSNPHTEVFYKAFCKTQAFSQRIATL